MTSPDLPRGRRTELLIERLEAELAHAQKLRAVGELAGGIAHDFNNLLTVIVGAAEAILDRAEADEQTRKDAGQIQATAARGAALVRQLLAFGRPQTPQPRAMAVDEAARDLSAMLGRLLGGRVRLTLDLQAPGRLVRVDPTQLDQVLVNLAVNARNAMPAGGTLTLRSFDATLHRPLTYGRDTIPPGRYVAIEVRDTGIGIPPDLLGRIFDPFFTTRHDQGGSGLGLSTAHGIVRQSGGLMTVESQPGQGTAFSVYLPCHGVPEDVPETVAPPAAEPRDGRTVLLIEDEELVRRLAEQVLTRLGWRVLAADSGEAALELLAAAPAEAAALAAVVADMVLPGMDGVAVVRIVRTQRPDLPAILVSGYAEETLRRDLARDNIAFLPKPYGPKELVARLDRLVQTGAFIMDAATDFGAGSATGDVRR
jgi:two-component system cell cycle sensor histidine kinase/response regulator CckA